MAHNPRKLVTFTISAAEDKNGYIVDVLKQACQQISRRYAGCNMTTGTGFWSADGDDDRADYGNVNSEPSWTVTVTTIASAEALILDAKDAFRYWLQGTDVNWIDCNVTDVEAHHFSIA